MTGRTAQRVEALGITKPDDGSLIHMPHVVKERAHTYKHAIKITVIMFFNHGKIFLYSRMAKIKNSDIPEG